jgi:hypothetical protein
VEKAGIMHGYLENQYFSPQVSVGHNLIWKRGAANTGRPYLARAAEEHSGPHMPWFWNGEQQGGGVLNDMMCHSVLVVRQLLTPPGESLTTLVPKRVTGHIASLKWSRKEYAAQLKKTMGVDYLKKPSEDFASVTIEFETPDGGMAIGEATTSWSFVGPGLRLSAELLGQCQTSRREIDNNRARLAACLDALEDPESDDAGAHDHQDLIVLRVSQIDCMKRGGEGFVGCGFFEADVVRNRNHAAGDLRCDPQKLRIAAHADRGIAPADLHRRHLTANFHDLATELMAEDSALLDRQPKLKKQAFTIGVKIRSANAAGSDPHQRLAFIQFGSGDLFESDVARAMKYRGFHDGLSFSLVHRPAGAH